jgi:ubiquinone/menaquinone biosynthesis C-methylase UbiE
MAKVEKQVSSYLNLKGDEHVLDVATGTGYVALSIAKELPDGKVTGIDFLSGMLTQAMRNRDEQGIHNVTFREMNMEAIDYQDKHFDVAVSAFSIFCRGYEKTTNPYYKESERWRCNPYYDIFR